MTIRHVATGEVFPQAAWVNSVVDALNDIHATATDQWEPLYRAEKRRADAAEAAVARVRALHQPLERRDVTECAFCIDTADWRYPCATVQALDAP